MNNRACIAPEVAVEVGAAVNNRAVLANCLARSPDIRSGALKLRTFEGCKSAALALNAALDRAEAPYVLLVHQDVYLPAGFAARLAKEISTVEAVDPDWAVAGVIGLDARDVAHGQTWSSGRACVVGIQSQYPALVETLDELLLLVRRASGVRFDENLPGFHLYAADIVQTAKALGRKSYVLDLPVIHHSRPVVSLGGDYRRAYAYMQRKWRTRLPLPNLICPIDRSSLRVMWRDVKIRLRARGRVERPSPTSDPTAIARQLGWE
jgi:hypothetical protein